LDFVQIAISARLAHGDLVAADQALEADPSVLGVRLILVKQLLLSCANVADLELISRGLYREHPEIGEIITPYRRNFEFAKYIRNIAVGHVNPALSRKAIEWRPELNSVLATPKPGGDAFLGFAILETAINTFVDGDSHRIFEGDTDLGYPPDLTRFLSFLGNTAHVGWPTAKPWPWRPSGGRNCRSSMQTCLTSPSELERPTLSSSPGRVRAAEQRRIRSDRASSTVTARTSRC
jgi:hypothetical protein